MKESNTCELQSNGLSNTATYQVKPIHFLSLTAVLAGLQVALPIATPILASPASEVREAALERAETFNQDIKDQDLQLLPPNVSHFASDLLPENNPQPPGNPEEAPADTPELSEPELILVEENGLTVKKWRATFWGGILTESFLNEAIRLDLDFSDSQILGIGGQRRITGKRLRLEGETHLLQYFGNQNHTEFLAGLGVRWQIVDRFSVALFDGLSFPTEIPTQEAEVNEIATQVLNYIGFEFEANIKKRWAIAARLHHRSGVFGFFDGATGGSNAVIFGLRYQTN